MPAKLTNGSKLQMQTRVLPIMRDGVEEPENGLRATVDEKERTLTLTYSSETPVPRWFGDEILDHTKSSVRMQRLNTKAPLLVNHDMNEQVGVVEKAFIKDRRGIAIVRFSKSAKGEEVFQDVLDGIRTLVSVGYRIFKTEVSNIDSAKELVRVMDWEPYEVSIVSAAADISVGVGRGAETEGWTVEVVEQSDQARTQQNQNPKIKPNNKMDNENQTRSTVEIVETPHKAGTESYGNVEAYQRAIAGTADLMKAGPSDVADALSRNLSTREFAAEYSKRNPPAPISTSQTHVGMSDKDKRNYSLSRAVLAMGNGRLEGLELEMHQEMLKKVGSERANKLSTTTFLIPTDMFATRAANATTGADGGYTVGTQIAGVVPLLQNRTVLDRLGVTSLTDLQGNLVFPVLTSGTAAAWVTETGAVSDSVPVWGQRILTPHRCSATVPFSTQFLAQSSVSAEAFFRKHLMEALDVKIDAGGLVGTGADAQPTGVKNVSGVNATVTFGGAAVWADIVEFETGITADNADVGSMAFALSPATVGKWKSISRDTGSGIYLINDAGLANGYRYERTGSITGDYAIFGVWSQLVRGEWLGTEVTVDPYALKKSGQIEVTVNRLVDFAAMQPQAFNVSTDSAAQ